MSEILSPITGKSNVQIVKRLHKEVIVRDYLSKLNIDVSRFYNGVGDYLEIYQCEDTGYKFFAPDSLAGDGDFYDTIVNDGKYYSQWKKEYDFGKRIAREKNAKTVLDVGCGSGQFIEAASKFAIATGLELSDEAIRIGKKKDLDLRNETLTDHLTTHARHYDFVSAYQVLEHVPNVKEFLTQLIGCLAPGGSLVLSVPNCEPFIARDHWYGIANLPPHHMGLWNLSVFARIPDYFPLELVESDFDVRYSILRTGLYSGLSMAKHHFPKVKNEKLIRAFGAAYAAFFLPSYVVSDNATCRYSRVMVHFRKT